MKDSLEIRHFHLFCGIGGGARGFNAGQARLGRALLAAGAGETFTLEATPVWARRIAALVSVEN